MIKQIILLSAGIALGSSAWAGSISSSINKQLNTANSSNLMASENMQQLAQRRGRSPGYGGSRGSSRRGGGGHHNSHGDHKYGTTSTQSWVPSKSP